ncbi:MAG: S-layer homology domain-containing protein [Oscillospiraceae bacterium]|nr:S-layer homology domain-containing protein [Oscillospiraceae bacterium]
MRWKKTAICLMLAAGMVLAARPPAASAEQAGTAFDRMRALLGGELQEGRLMIREEVLVCVAAEFMDTGGRTELPFDDIGGVAPERLRYISMLYESGILTGVERQGGLYLDPGGPMTRQQVFTLLGRVLGKTSEYEMPFTDAAEIGPWAAGYLAWFAERGVIRGYADGRLGPSDHMRAGHVALLLQRTIDYRNVFDIEISDLAGAGGRGFSDGGASEASFCLPYGVAADGEGNLAVFDTYNNAIRIISGGKTETLAGRFIAEDENRFSKGYYSDGALDSALFNRPSGGVYNKNGDLFVCDSGNNVVRIIRGGEAYTFAGTERGFADGAGDRAKFGSPLAAAIDGSDNLYVADTLNNCIRKIDPDGNVITIAGRPGVSGYADGAASEALFREPAGIAVTEDGSAVYVSDTGNHRIRKIENGLVTTLAGVTHEEDEDGYAFGGYADGAAAQAMFNLPAGLCLADGALMVADSGNSRVRAVTKAGWVVTVAGNGEAGDKGGEALAAELDHPMGVYYGDGLLYIADTTNNKIKTVPADIKLYEELSSQ